MRIKTASFQALLCLLLHFMLLAPPAALARDIRVDENCSLHDAITTYNTETSTGGCRMPTWGKPHIYLKSDITLTEPLPIIWTDLSIDGVGHQISGDKLHQVFVVHNHDLTISNLHIVDGFSAENGGAIHVRNGELKLSNSSISNSTASENGGAIYAATGTISIRKSFISGNSAGNGSAVYLDQGGLNLSESVVSGNMATRSGAIHVWRSATTIADSQVERNFAKESAGGILAVDSYIEIKHSKVHANRAMDQGGGLLLVSVDASIVDTTISDNLAGNNGGAIYWERRFSNYALLGGLKLTQSALTGNRAIERGGALFVVAPDVHVSNTTFYDNRAGGNGGALYLENREATMTHVTIADNAALNGGGVYTRAPDLLNLRNSLIAGSKGGDCVGGLAENRGNWIEDGSCKPRYRGDPQLTRFAGSPLYFPLQRESLAINRAAPDYCLEHDQHGTSRPQGDACDIGAYEAVDWVDAEYINPLRTPVKSPDIIVDEDCSLADAIRSANRDEAMGGCIAGAGPDTIRITGDFKVNDIMPDITGEIVIESENHKLGGVQFVIRYGNLTINNLSLKGFGASYLTDFSGGAIYIRYGRLRLSKVSIMEALAAKDGGAIYSHDSDIVISDSVFANNEAQEFRGGALYIYNGSVSISNSIFTGNIGELSGGAIYAASSTAMQITDSIFHGNATTDQGGAIFSYSSFDLTDSSLQRNQAAKGGAIATGAYATADMENVTFADNTADECPKIFEQIEERCD